MNGLMTSVKNFDKLKTEEDREFVRCWSKITTIIITSDSYYMLDMISTPGFKEVK